MDDYYVWLLSPGYPKKISYEHSPHFPDFESCIKNLIEQNVLDNRLVYAAINKNGKQLFSAFNFEQLALYLFEKMKSLADEKKSRTREFSSYFSDD